MSDRIACTARTTRGHLCTRSINARAGKLYLCGIHWAQHRRQKAQKVNAYGYTDAEQAAYLRGRKDATADTRDKAANQSRIYNKRADEHETNGNDAGFRIAYAKAVALMNFANTLFDTKTGE